MGGAGFRTRFALIGGLATSVLVGCGYRPVYAGTPPDERLSVVAHGVSITRAGAVHAAVAGARAELATARALSKGQDSYPRLVIEITRMEEAATGVVARETPTGLVPSARGSRVGVTGRAWVVVSHGAPVEERTPDLRRTVHVASGATAVSDRSQNREAVEAAATRLGRDLARFVLGVPTIEREPM